MTQAINDPAKSAAISADDHEFVFHSWSAQGAIKPLPVSGSAGSRFWDYAGNTYLDFSSQLVFTNIGHQHPKLIAAIQEQAARLCTIAPAFANDARSEAARLIAELAPGDLNMVFFTNGGAEIFDMAGRGRIDAFFLSGGQIDGQANINLVGTVLQLEEFKRMKRSYP